MGRHGSQVERALAEEWVRLNQDPSCTLVLRRWAVHHRCLTGCDRVGDVIDALDAAESQARDELLAALIALFQQGHALAGRIALQAMLPKVASLAARRLARRHGSLEDRFQLVIGEFWQVLGDYPLERRPGKVAANLAMETLHRLVVLSRAREVPLDPVVIAELGHPEQVAPASSPSGRIDRDCSLPELLDWAVGSQVVSSADAGLLLEVFGCRTAGADTYRDVARAYREIAAATGVSGAALRQRVHRAKTRLGAAARLAVAT